MTPKHSKKPLEITPDLDARIAQYMGREITPATPDYTEAKEKWLAYERDANDTSESTIQSYGIGFDVFLNWLSKPLIEVNTPDIVEYKNYLKEMYTSPKSVNLRLSAIRSFFRFAVAIGELPYSPAQIVKGQKIRKSTVHKRGTLTNQQVRNLLETCTGDDPVNVRDRAILALLCYCGLRVSEIHHANTSDLRTRQGKKVLFVKGKGRIEKDEYVVIPPHQEQYITAWKNLRKMYKPKDNALFVSVGNRARGERLSIRNIIRTIRNRLDEIQVEDDVTVHSLRHTALTNAYEHGAQPMQVKSMARHANFETTLNYIHSKDRLDAPAEYLINYEEGE